MGNIVGLDLKVDQEYLANAVQQTVMMGIAESLNGKNEIVSQLVKSVLQTKVTDKGTISTYAGDNKYSLLEFHVRQMLTEVVKEEMKAMVAEKRDEIGAVVRRELSKKSTAEAFVSRFISTVERAIDATWVTKIDVNFEKQKE